MTPERSILLVPARPRDLGGFAVLRVLPAPSRRAVGPFVFLDHMGPVTAAPGHALDVAPHPHVGLSTLTYLLDGETFHRDSLGSAQRVAPGEVSFMTAGRGIVHSERTPADALALERRLFGLQLWVALPAADEETEPSYAHHAARELPRWEGGGALRRLVAGTAFGARSPVPVRSSLFLLDVEAQAGARIELPEEHAERAVYVLSGRARLGSIEVGARTLAVLPEGSGAPPIETLEPTRCVVLGGAPLDGPRHIWWNFVSSRPERIEEAARAWREGRFPGVPGDPGPPVPLHEEPRFGRRGRT